MKKFNHIFNLTGLIILILCFGWLLYGDHHYEIHPLQENQNVHEKIQVRTDQIYNSIIAIRRDIHQYPELAGREKRTSKLVAEYLNSLGLKVITNIGGYGVIGILQGKHPGAVIGWRADMDALPLKIKEKSEFASKIDGVNHFCGHDVHTSIALGMANVLASIKDNLRGRIVFIFQPSEENFQGAKAMVEDGLFDKIIPDMLFALHIVPIPYNQIAVKSKEMFAYRRIKLNVKLNKSGNKEEIKNEIIEFIKKLDTLPGQNIFTIPLDDTDSGILNSKCVIRDYFVVMDNTVKAKDIDGTIVIQTEIYSSSIKNISSKINVIKTSKWKDFIDSVTYSPAFWQIPVYNDPDITKNAWEIIESIYGQSSIIPIFGITPMFNDDFAVFQNEIPGVYFFLGGSNPEKGIISMPHSPNFSVDERCIKTGINYFSSLIYSLMIEKSEKEIENNFF